MKRGGPSHPKTFELAEKLSIRRVQAVGILEMMFHFAAQYAPEGDIGRYDDKRIAAALDWHGPVQKLIDSLVTTRWVDRHPTARLVLHDWASHADRTTLQRLARAGKKPIETVQGDKPYPCTQIETSGFNVGALPEPVPKPVPEPEPSGGGETGSEDNQRSSDLQPAAAISETFIEQIGEYIRLDELGPPDRVILGRIASTLGSPDLFPFFCERAMRRNRAATVRTYGFFVEIARDVREACEAGAVAKGPERGQFSRQKGC